MSLSFILIISAICIVIGLLMSLIYEVLALINIKIPFTPNLPLISDIVIPWVAKHRLLATTLTAIVMGFMLWLILHFFLG